MERRSLLAVEVGTVLRLSVLAGFALARQGSSDFLTGGGDAARYAVYATGQPVEHLATWFPWEYPALARTLMGLVPGGSPATYVTWFMLGCLAVDLAVLLWLARRASGEAPVSGAWLWALAVPLLGVVPYTRFDVVVVALVMVALVRAQHQPVAAALLVSVATSLKWWPLLVLPLVVAAAPRSRRGVVLAAGTVPWLIAELAGVAAWGTSSITRPVDWLSSRGVQVESTVALPGLWRWRSGGPGPQWLHNTAEFAEVGWWPAVVSLLGIALIAAVLAGGVRRLRRGLPGDVAPLVLALSAVSAVAVLLVAGRVLSPQYLLWLIGPLAVLASIPGSAVRTSWLALACSASALTTAVFPLGFDALLRGGLVPLLALTARNIVLVVLALLLVRAWWVAVGQWAASPREAESQASEAPS